MVEREQVAQQGYSVLAERSVNTTWNRFLAKPPTRQAIRPLLYDLVRAEELRYNGHIPETSTDPNLKKIIAAQNLRTDEGRRAAAQLFLEMAQELQRNISPYLAELELIYPLQKQGIVGNDPGVIKEAEEYVATVKTKITYCKQAVELIP